VYNGEIDSWFGTGAENALQMAAKFLLTGTCVAGAQSSGFTRFSLNIHNAT
jgi:hypothetical protein